MRMIQNQPRIVAGRGLKRIYNSTPTSNCILQPKIHASRYTDVTMLENDESILHELDNISSSSIQSSSSTSLRRTNKRRRCERRCLMFSNTLVKDCEEVRRQFHQNDNLGTTILHSHGNKHKNEQLLTKQTSTECLLKETLRLVKDLKLVASTSTSSSSKFNDLL